MKDETIYKNDMNNVADTDFGTDTTEYELNLNPNSEIYEEQQRSAAAVNGSGWHKADHRKGSSLGWKSWFRKK